VAPEKPKRRRAKPPGRDANISIEHHSPGENEEDKIQARLDAALERIEREEAAELRRKARDTRTAGLEVEKKQYEKTLKELEQPVEEQEDTLTPDEQLKFFKILDETKPEIITSAMQRLIDYNVLKQYKGLQKFEMALAQAKLSPPPPKLDQNELTNAMLDMAKKGMDIGIMKGKKMAKDEFLTLILKKMDEKGYYSKPSETTGTTPSAKSASVSQTTSSTSQTSKIQTETHSTFDASQQVQVTFAHKEGATKAGGSTGTGLNIKGCSRQVELNFVCPQGIVATSEVFDLRNPTDPSVVYAGVAFGVLQSVPEGKYEITLTARDEDGRTGKAYYYLTVKPDILFTAR